jgi:hypothetical protein
MLKTFSFHLTCTLYLNKIHMLVFQKKFKKLSWMNLVVSDRNVHNWNFTSPKSLTMLTSTIAQQIGDGNFHTKPLHIMVSCALPCALCCQLNTWLLNLWNCVFLGFLFEYVVQRLESLLGRWVFGKCSIWMMKVIKYYWPLTKI